MEQNLATGADAQGEPITDPMKDMMPCLFNRKIGYNTRRMCVCGCVLKCTYGHVYCRKLVKSLQKGVNFSFFL